MNAGLRSAADVARDLRISLPRVHRGLDRLQVPAAGGRGRRRVIAPDAARAIEARLAPVAFATGSGPMTRTGPGNYGCRPTLIAPGTLKGVFRDTKLQFLDASAQSSLAPPIDFAGLKVATVPDLSAMKLKVVGDRAELRDYVDLMAIIEGTDLTLEDGFALLIERFAPRGSGRCGRSSRPVTGPPR
ncbi:MAG: hypothetical protein U0Q21_06795 [Dermatophilaceae bacterium]